MSKREVARQLRAALQAMNDSGRHWLRGKMHRTRNGEMSFCSLGAINHVTGRPNVPTKGYKVDDSNRAAIYALANAIRKQKRMPPLFDDDNEAVYTVWSFNDQHGRTWVEIEDVFRKAAREPVFPT